MPKNMEEGKHALDTLERYSGSKPSQFRSNLILTNFPPYVDYFAKTRHVPIHEGTMFKVAHCEKEDVTILDFKIGSPAAALVIDVCSFLPIKAAVFLGMCGGLRRRYKVGEYLVPVAAIRGEGTSDFYFPTEVPALSNFLMQKAVTEVLEKDALTYHIGITYTTNTRFWEFNEDFITRLKITKAQGIEMECATLFAASYKRRLTLGTILLISDLPLNREGGIKTKESAKHIFETYTAPHVELGVKILHHAREMQSQRIKGSYHHELGS